MANPPKSTQEVVLRLDDETMQRLIVGVAGHLRDATTSQSLSQQQLPVTKSTGPAYTGLEVSFDYHILHILATPYKCPSSSCSESRWRFCLVIRAPLKDTFSRQRVKLHEGETHKNPLWTCNKGEVVENAGNQLLQSGQRKI